MIRIKGGPSSNDIKVFNIADDGVETEITGILSISIDMISPRSSVVACIEFIEVELDLLADKK